MSSTSDGSGVASGPSRLCRTHRRASTFVDFNHVASGVCAAREAFETPRASRDDRVGVGAGLDHVTLVDLLVEERVESVATCAEGIDLTHKREYRKSGFAVVGRFGDRTCDLGIESGHWTSSVLSHDLVRPHHQAKWALV